MQFRAEMFISRIYLSHGHFNCCVIYKDNYFEKKKNSTLDVKSLFDSNVFFFW